MHNYSRRKINIVDMICLIAATACGIAAAMAYLNRVVVERKNFMKMLYNRLSNMESLTWLKEDLRDAIPFFLLSYSICLLLLRLRTPRPAARDVIKRLGGSACLASLFVIIVHTFSFLANWIVKMVSIRRFFWFRLTDYAIGIGGETASAISAVWLVLIVGRYSRRTWDPIEAMQFALGIAWIAQLFSPAVIAIMAD